MTDIADHTDDDLLDREAVPHAVSLLGIGYHDYKAAVALHGDRHFPQAVFLLQQAVEKAVKALGIAARAVAITDLTRPISHNTFDVYLRGLRKFAAFAKPHAPLDMTSVEAALRSAEQARQKFADLSRLTRHEFLMLFGTYASIYESNKLDAVSDEFADRLKKALPRLRMESEELRKRTRDFVFSASTLFVLSLVTFAHAVPTRYGQDGKTPGAIYTESHPLVEHFSFLSSLVLHSIHRAVNALEDPA